MAEPGFPLVRTPADLALLGNFPAVSFDDSGHLCVTVPVDPARSFKFNSPYARIKINNVGCTILAEDIHKFVVYNGWPGWLNAAKKHMPNLREIRLVNLDMDSFVTAVHFGANFHRLVIENCIRVDTYAVDRWRRYGYEVIIQ
jgi:hypothetical protein